VIASLANTAFQYGRHVQLLSNLAHVLGFSFECKNGRSGNDTQVSDSRQFRYQLIGHSIAKVILVFCRTQVEEGHHGDRFLRARYRTAPCGAEYSQTAQCGERHYHNRQGTPIFRDNGLSSLHPPRLIFCEIPE
jgi:hypothetical protein